METYTVTLYAGDRKATAEITCDSDRIVFRYNDLEMEHDGTVPFRAIREIRRRLEVLDIQVAINASRVNVHPSGMQAVTQSAYLLYLGRPSLAADVVHILNPCSKDEIATVAAQEAFFKKWIASLYQDGDG